MIVFHEGLPRHGKSYEAVVKQIVPTLIRRRAVYTNIDGIDYERFSEVTEIPMGELKNLLFCITNKQVKDVWRHVANDSLVVIDELQDYFPASKSPLDDDMTKFVTQHGHRGIDIVCMGQDHRDCHMLWKRRIDTLITFVKRDVVGRPHEYTWATHRLKKGRFVELASGVGEYEKKYFGLYKSHVDGVKQIDTHKDDRINIFKTKAFRVYIPLFAIVFLYCVYYLYGYFHPAAKENAPSKPEVLEYKDNKQSTQPVTPIVTPLQNIAKTVTPNDELYIDDLLSKYRPRLLALLESSDKTRIMAIIDFLDENNISHERLDIPQLVALGYFVERRPYGLLLRRGDLRIPVTSFPVQHSQNITTSGDGSALPIQGQPVFK